MGQARRPSHSHDGQELWTSEGTDIVARTKLGSGPSTENLPSIHSQQREQVMHMAQYAFSSILCVDPPGADPQRLIQRSLLSLKGRKLCPELSDLLTWRVMSLKLVLCCCHRDQLIGPGKMPDQPIPNVLGSPCPSHY